MVWQRLATKRLGNDIPNLTANFTDGFDQYASQGAADGNWVSTGVNAVVNITNDEIDWDCDNTVTDDDSVVYDLMSDGIYPSDTNWTLRYKFDIKNFTHNTDGTGQQIICGISDSDGAVFADGNQDAIGLRTQTSSGGDIHQTVDANAAAWTSGGTQFVHAVVAETLYVEIKRTSDVTYECSLYSDATYTTLIEKVLSVVAAGTVDLRYVKFIIWEPDATPNGTLDGAIDDVQFFNGTEGVQSHLTPKLETPKTLDLDDDFNYSTAKTADNSFDFTSDTGWSTTDTTNIDIDDNKEFLKWHMVRDGSNDGIAFDVGAGNIDDEQWTLRWKFSVNEITAGTNCTGYIGLMDADETETYAGPKDAIYMNFNGGSLAMGSGDGNQVNLQTGQNTAMSTVIALRPMYMVLTRLDDSNARFQIFSDANYSELIEEDNFSLAANIASLRYIVLQNIASSANTSAIDVAIDDMEFFNGRVVANTPIEETPTLDDDFSGADNWVETGTKNQVNVSTDVIDWDGTRDGSNHKTVFDLTTVDDNEWTLRFKWTVDSQTYTSGANPIWYAGIVDTDNTVGTTDSSNTGLYMEIVSDTSPLIRFKSELNNDLNLGTLEYTFTETPTAGTRYVEIKKTANATGVMTLYRDPDYTNVIETSGELGLEVTDSLRYVFFATYPTGSGATATLDGTVDDVKFWDAQSALTHQNIWNVFRGVKDGGSNDRHIRVETDLRKIHFDITADSADDGIQQHLWTDLGASVSQNNWSVRWDMIFENITTNASLDWFFGISDLDGTNDAGINRDGLFFTVTANTTTTWGIRDVDGADLETEANSDSVTTPTLAVDTKYYCQLSRIDETTFTFTVFTDPNYSEVLLSLRATTVDTIVGLRYFCILNETLGNGGQLLGTMDNFKFINGSANIDGPCEGFDRLQIMVNMLNDGAIDPGMRFNGDASGTDNTDALYHTRKSINGGADLTTTYDHRTYGLIGIDIESQDLYNRVEIPSNLTGDEINFIAHGTSPTTAGEATAPNRSEAVGKWEGLEEVHTVALYNNEAGDYDTDSEISIFGEVKEVIGGEDNFRTLYEALT